MNTEPVHRRVVLLGPYLLLGVTACSCAVLLFGPVVSIPAKIVRNYDEGWNAYQVSRAFTDGLYPPVDSLISNNYPPLSYYINAVVSPLVGDPIMTGRVLALAGLCLTAVNVGFLVFYFGKNRLFGSFAGLAFLGTMAASFHGGYVAMADPQWLGHGVMTTALVIFLRSQRRVCLLILSAVTMVLAGLIKHTLIPVPLAATVWCLVYERKVLPVWSAASVSAAAVAVSLLFAIFGRNAVLGILYSGREYSFYSSVLNVSQWVSPGLAFPPCLLLLAGSTFHSHGIRLLYLYAASSATWGFLMSGVPGVNYNSLFDLYIAVIILSAIAIAGWVNAGAATGFGRAARQTVGMVALALPVLVAAPQEAAQVPNYLSRLQQREQETAKDVAFISAHDGLVVCEYLSLCYWGGKPFSMDFFMAGQKMKSGLISQDALIRRVTNHEFNLIQLGENERVRTWLPERVLAAIDGHYVVARKSPTGGLFYVPSQ